MTDALVGRPASRIPDRNLMTLHKCETWPRVLVNDDGLRPNAGSPDACFYCNSKVGEQHGRECVTVGKIVRYRVWMNLDARADEDNNGRVVGTFTCEDPHFWTEHNCEFHKNDSSWCADNSLERIQWDDPSDAEILNRVSADSCSCSFLYFEFDAVIDPGPLVRLS